VVHMLVAIGSCEQACGSRPEDSTIAFAYTRCHDIHVGVTHQPF